MMSIRVSTNDDVLITLIHDDPKLLSELYKQLKQVYHLNTIIEEYFNEYKVLKIEINRVEIEIVAPLRA